MKSKNRVTGPQMRSSYKPGKAERAELRNLGAHAGRRPITAADKQRPLNENGKKGAPHGKRGTPFCRSRPSPRHKKIEPYPASTMSTWALPHHSDEIGISTEPNTPIIPSTTHSNPGLEEHYGNASDIMKEGFTRARATTISSSIMTKPATFFSLSRPTLPSSDASPPSPITSSLPATTRCTPQPAASSSCIMPPNSYAGLSTPSTPPPSGSNISQQPCTALPKSDAPSTPPDMATHIDNTYRTDWENFVAGKSVQPKICECQRHPKDRTHPANYKPSAMRELLRQQGEDPNLFMNYY